MTTLTPHPGRQAGITSRIDRSREDDPPPCQMPSRNERTPICSRWSICQRGAACESFRIWSLTGKTDLRLGRAPTRKVYRVLFSSTDHKSGGVKSAA